MTPGIRGRIGPDFGDPGGLAAADDAVWVAANSSGSLAWIDARTGTVTNAIRVGDAPAAIAAGPAGLWVLDPLDATVSRVDPRREAIQATVPLGGAPTAIAAQAQVPASPMPDLRRRAGRSALVVNRMTVRSVPVVEE